MSNIFLWCARLSWALLPLAAGDALDLRLGSTARSVTILLREPATFGRRRGRTGGLLVGTDVVLVAPVLRDALLVAADRRRIPT